METRVGIEPAVTRGQHSAMDHHNQQLFDFSRDSSGIHDDTVGYSDLLKKSPQHG